MVLQERNSSDDNEEDHCLSLPYAFESRAPVNRIVYIQGQHLALAPGAPVSQRKILVKKLEPACHCKGGLPRPPALLQARP